MADFAAQLAKLNQTAASANSRDDEKRSRGEDGQDREGHHKRRRRPEDHHRGGRGRGGGGYRGRNHDRRRMGNRGDGERGSADDSRLECLVEMASRYRIPTPTDHVGRHLALLFLTIDDLPMEDLWRRWLEEEASSLSDQFTISVICHAKQPERVKSPWLQQRLLRQRRSATADASNVAYHTRRPAWGSIDLTRAMIDLVHEALLLGQDKKNPQNERPSAQRYVVFQNNASQADSAEVKKNDDDDTTTTTTTPNALPPVDAMVFLSESCLPVATRKEVEMAVFGPHSGDTQPQTQDNETTTEKATAATSSPTDHRKSWLKAFDKPDNGYARQLQWDPIPLYLRDHVWKADQWILLTRSHAQAVLQVGRAVAPDDPELWRCFSRTKASDEIYFPTVLALVGVLTREETACEKPRANPTSSGGQDDDDDDEEERAHHWPEVARRRVTYSDWSQGAKSPVTFPLTLQEVRSVIAAARKEGCLFARKFVPAGASPQGTSGESVPDTSLSFEEWFKMVQPREK